MGYCGSCRSARRIIFEPRRICSSVLPRRIRNPRPHAPTLFVVAIGSSFRAPRKIRMHFCRKAWRQRRCPAVRRPGRDFVFCHRLRTHGAGRSRRRRGPCTAERNSGSPRRLAPGDDGRCRIRCFAGGNRAGSRRSPRGRECRFFRRPRTTPAGARRARAGPFPRASRRP